MPLCLPTASISSIKIIQGEFCLALENNFLTLAAPRPTYNSTNSLAAIEIKLALHSLAIALAIRVLPVPGGPSNKIPLGIWAPAISYRVLLFK